MLIQLDLKKNKRKFAFSYPLSRAGFFTDLMPGVTAQTNPDTEICFRLECETPLEEDEFDSGTFRTPFPHVVYKHAGMFHRFRGEGRRNGVYFAYSTEISKKLLADGFLNREILLQQLKPAEFLQNLIEDFQEIVSSPDEPFFADRLDLAAFHLLEELQISARNEIEPCDEERRIRKAANYLRFHPDLPVNIPVLANQFGFSQRNFYRCWNRYFQVSPVNYALEQKIRQAENLLIYSRAAIGEIALQLHFCHINYFSNCFRKFRGMTPYAWRKTHEQMKNQRAVSQQESAGNSPF